MWRETMSKFIDGSGPRKPVSVVLAYRKQFLWINRMPRIGRPKHGPVFSDVRVRVCALSHTVKISPSCPMDASLRLPLGARRLTTWLLTIEAAAARFAPRWGGRGVLHSGIPVRALLAVEANLQWQQLIIILHNQYNLKCQMRQRPKYTWPAYA